MTELFFPLGSLSSSTEHKSSSSMTNGKSSLTQSSRSGAGNSTPTKGDPAKISQVKKQLIREKIARQELLEPQRTKFPELKVSKGDGVDKLKQVCSNTFFYTELFL